MIHWPQEWFLKFWSDWLTDCLIDGLMEWLIDWLIDRLIDGLTGWLTDWLMDWLIDRLNDWLPDCDWLTEWLPDCDWLTECIAWFWSSASQWESPSCLSTPSNQDMRYNSLLINFCTYKWSFFSIWLGDRLLYEVRNVLIIFCY